MRVLVTGASSFIGRNFVDYVLQWTGWEVVSLERLGSKTDPRIEHLYHDIRAEVPFQVKADVIVHFAAEVSASKSLADPHQSVETNVVGTYNMLELARRIGATFVYISTGEVLGSVPVPFKLKEDAPLRPASPYAASKAAGEALVNAYHVSFQVPTIIVRSMNLFGPGQTRGFVPDTINKLLHHKTITCHVKHGEPCSRNWLHVEYFCEMLTDTVSDGLPGEIYHAVGSELNNLEVIEVLSRSIQKPPFIENVECSFGHDFRCVLQDTKLGYGDYSETLDDLAVTAKSYLEAKDVRVAAS